LLRSNSYKHLQELGWGERTRVGAAEVRAFEVNHWGARMRSDTYRGYNGYVIESGRYRVLFAGDTAHTSAFRSLRTSKSIDLAIMPVGAYDPWIYYHCTPEQAWRMGGDAGAELFIPVHHQTFQLSREPVLEPIERFHRAAGSSLDRVVIERIGQQFHI
jgi:L-ascorbate metabolism protein UlaG (beta-lactamase superfamily)